MDLLFLIVACLSLAINIISDCFCRAFSWQIENGVDTMENSKRMEISSVIWLLSFALMIICFLCGCVCCYL